MKRFLPLLTALLLAPLTALHSAETMPANKPNVIVILSDDLGWADLSCYGSTFHESPNLDKLAAQGMRFTQAYSSSPYCSPSRAAIMTGRLTLAQALERGGRTTGPDVASIRRDINDKVAQFRSSVMRMEIDVPDPNRVGRTMKVRLKPEQQQQMIDEYRSGLEQDYGLRAARTTPRGGGTSAGGMDNIGTILDRTTAFGAEGPMSPMTWQSSSGKTYKFQ